MTDRFRPILIVHALAACLLLVTAFGTATAAAEKRIQFNIAAQDLASALNEFARQSDQELMFSSELALAKRTSGVIGEFAPTDALRALLQGTGLRFRINRKNTILIERDVNETAWRAEETRALYGASLALAQEGGERPPSAPASNNSAARASAGLEGTSKTLEQVLEEVLVTGSWIRGVVPAGSPLTTYTRDDIELSGVATVSQFARYMPENFASVDPTGARVINTGNGGFAQSAENTFGGSGFNLRGLGPVATLTLLNGRRLAPAGSDAAFVDISAIPLAAIDRIEVMADGASALYGADAIAGVVNIVLRDDFQGAETSARYGATADGGGEELTASQLLGASWGNGGALITLAHDGQQALHAADRDYIPPRSGQDTLRPAMSTNTFMFTGHQSLTDTSVLSLDAYFGDRNTRGENSLVANRSISEAGVETLGGTLAFVQELPGEWQLDVSGTASTFQQEALTHTPAINRLTTSTADTEVTAMALRADGPLFSMPAGVVRAAIGGDLRSENLLGTSRTITGTTAGIPTRSEFSRDVWSVVGEVFVPIVGTETAVPGVQRLELSVAGRHDNYDDVGSTTNPKFGVLWSPIAGLNIRSTYSDSFHAPLLRQLFPQKGFIGLRLPNPAAPSGFTNTILIDGNGDGDLDPETAQTLTAGFDVVPAALPHLFFTATYWDIDFADRIARPPVGNPSTVWLNPAALAPFIDSSPDPAFVQSIFAGTAGGNFINVNGLTPATTEALFNFLPQNMAGTRMSGVDVAVSYRWPTNAGVFGASFSGTKITKNDFQIVSTMPVISLNDKLGAPADLRLIGGVSWSHRGFAASLRANYWDEYVNPLPNPDVDIDSWLTLDVQLRYDAPESAPAALQGLSISLDARNVANEEPPQVRIPFGAFDFGYDPQNATPDGRVLSLMITKTW